MALSRRGFLFTAIGSVVALPLLKFPPEKEDEAYCSFELKPDSTKLFFGNAEDASIYTDGCGLITWNIVNPATKIL